MDNSITQPKSTLKQIIDGEYKLKEFIKPSQTELFLFLGEEYLTHPFLSSAISAKNWQEALLIGVVPELATYTLARIYELSSSNQIKDNLVASKKIYYDVFISCKENLKNAWNMLGYLID